MLARLTEDMESCVPLPKMKMLRWSDDEALHTVHVLYPGPCSKSVRRLAHLAFGTCASFERDAQANKLGFVTINMTCRS